MKNNPATPSLTHFQKVSLGKAFLRFCKDRDVSVFKRAIIGIVGPTLIVSPIDFVPGEPFNLVGFSDDIVILLIILATIRKYRHLLHPKRHNTVEDH